ncbi:hypothetical protein BDA99DRAFT_359463 [Phascolomyces articulosus]|uniref:Heterokaryon incompatibility domain-containing protein n=1 Tax=Phascolomyces articulosus TaxID=60185 RepID=A0AAD5KE05_9FUNG|nr:hypothetical protein BDA99DRAFT_359463 [Phascolomyces articulosus]
MYITYETTQYARDTEGKFFKYGQPPKTIPNDLPKPEFMPTKLVRISDMKVIDDAQVSEGYCALSYSWSQSGKIVKDERVGKYTRMDEGKHKIIYSNDSYEYVKFEGMVQYICQQFNIKYIWCDQLCINQDDKEEKQYEICNMHHIYENAYCTVALVPEYDDELYGDEEYFKRLWTLEEALKSKRLLFIGRNIHEWGEDVNEDSLICELVKPLSELKVNEILYYAHRRTTTKDHDRVFALIHLFPDLIDNNYINPSYNKPLMVQFYEWISTRKNIEKINIDYDQPLEDLMVQFYGVLAKKNICILLWEKSQIITNQQFINTTFYHHGQVSMESISHLIPQHLFKIMISLEKPCMLHLLILRTSDPTVMKI